MYVCPLQEINQAWIWPHPRSQTDQPKWTYRSAPERYKKTDIRDAGSSSGML